jgi:hypothetical protein
MKQLILKVSCISIISLLLSLPAGCDGTRTQRKSKKIRTSAQVRKKTSDVGVGDVADYATGVTQLTAKQKTEKQLKNIYSTHNKEQEKALKK